MLGAVNPVRAMGTMLVGSLLVNLAFLLGPGPAAPPRSNAEEASCPSGAAIQCEKLPSYKCTCDGRPLGTGTANRVSFNYPYGNRSLDSIYDTQGFLAGKLLPLSDFKAKAILVGNTASN
jgi:hypothetical protein